MSLITSEEYDALTRINFQVFVERVFVELNRGTAYADNFHIGVLCAEFEAVRRGETTRLIINVPPRSLKSIIASVAFPAFVLGHKPTKKFIGISYGQDLSEVLSRQCRQVMLSAWYQRVFPLAALSPDRRSAHDFETTSGGGRLATSVGGAITGLGGDFLVVDDPIKPEDALSDTERSKANRWFDSTLSQRLNDKVTGSVIVVMQRLHEDDFTGHVLRQEEWRHVSFAAIASADERHFVRTPYGSYTHMRAEGEALHPGREPLEVLERLRRTMGTAFFSAQYLQAPMSLGGNIVKEAWFPRFDLDSPPKFDKIFQSWDTASKVAELRDYSVCTTWGLKGKHRYLISVYRERLEYPDLKRAVRRLALLHQATTIVIEDRVSGVPLYQDLRREGMRGLVAYNPKRDKEVRLHAQTPEMEDGLVHLPISAPWLKVYLYELMSFPKGSYDDQVDSTSQALDWARNGNDVEDMIKFLANQFGGPALARDEVPSIRVRHADGGMSLQTITGRSPPREPDGSFLLTKEEWMPSLVGAGFIREN